MAFVLDNAKHLPCQVTVAEVKNLGTGRNRIADIRKRELKDKALVLTQLATEPKKYVDAELKVDIESMIRYPTLALDHTAQFYLFALDTFIFNIFNNSGANISNFAYRYSFFLAKPTIADKIFRGISLTDEERTIAEELDLTVDIEEGVFPLPLETYTERVFKPSTLRTKTWTGDVTTDGADIAKEYSPLGEILVLKSIACDKPPDATYTTELKLTVDDNDFLDIRAWAMSSATTDVPFFVPAIDSFAIRAETNTAVSNFSVRYTFATVKLTKYLQMLLGLIPEEEDTDLAKKIRAGVI